MNNEVRPKRAVSPTVYIVSSIFLAVLFFALVDSGAGDLWGALTTVAIGLCAFISMAYGVARWVCEKHPPKPPF